MLLLAFVSCTPSMGKRQPPPRPADSGTETGAPTSTVSSSRTGETGTTGDTATGGVGGQTGETGTVPVRLLAYVGAADDRIHVFEIDPLSGGLTETSDVSAGPAPTFLAFSPTLQRLYAVNESSDEISAFSVDAATGALTLLDRAPAGGDGPAHLTVDGSGQFVLAAHYGGGSVSWLPLAPDGSFLASASELSTGPNAHQIVLDPSNQFAFVPNLGSDEVSQLRFDPLAGTLVPNAPPSVALPADSGPRHLALHPAAPFAYVIGELGDTMTALSFDTATGQLTPLQTLSTLPAGVDGADSYCAEVAFGASGRFLYGSNRGHDSLVIFEVAPTGEMTLVGHQDTGGSWPRHFSVSPDGELLLVANQRSDNVVAFRVDSSSGLLIELATTPMPPGPAFVGIVALPEELPQ